MSVMLDQIGVSDKFNHNSEGFKYFIGYQEGGIVKPLCIILSEVSGYMKYFEKWGQKHVFLLKTMKCGKKAKKFGV